ncbi:MAG: magnesium transporter, partial [Methanobacterium sp.]
GNYRLIGLNVGFKGIIRRLGIESILKDLKIETPGEYIAWDDINIYESDEYNLKLKVTDYDLKKLHPSDMAEIIKELNDKDLNTILNSLDEDIAAGVLEEISSNRQVCLLDSMNNKKTANILNKMSPDSATDLFGCLSEDKADELLDLMNPEEANDIRKLLNYPPDTAGGIMTTEFAVINEEYTAHEILDYLRNIVKNIRFIYYIYLVSDEVLTGIASLKDVIFADPDQKANEFMVTDLITVDELENQIDVAKKIAKYNLLAIPVVNDKNEIKGIVTVDDAIEINLPSK